METSLECKRYRKWTAAEVMEILNYLKKNRGFERPSAQLYYRKFLENSKIEVSWNLIRFKVRHLKRSYLKAISWRRSSAARHLDKRSLRVKLLVICQFFDILHEIFGDQCSESSEQKKKNAKTTSQVEEINCVLRDDNEAFDESLDTLETTNDFDPVGNVELNCVVKVENESFEIYDSGATNNVELNYILKEEIDVLNEDIAELQQSTTSPPTSATDCSASPATSPAQPPLNHDISTAECNQRTEANTKTASADNHITSESLKGPQRTSFFENLTTLQKERREMQRDRLQFEYKKLKLEKRKLRLEEKKVQLTSEWQNKVFELQKLELELKYNTKKK